MAPLPISAVSVMAVPISRWTQPTPGDELAGSAVLHRARTSISSHPPAAGSALLRSAAAVAHVRQPAGVAAEVRARVRRPVSATAVPPRTRGTAVPGPLRRRSGRLAGPTASAAPAYRSQVAGGLHLGPRLSGDLLPAEGPGYLEEPFIHVASTGVHLLIRELRCDEQMRPSPRPCAVQCDAVSRVVAVAGHRLFHSDDWTGAMWTLSMSQFTESVKAPFLALGERAS